MAAKIPAAARSEDKVDITPMIDIVFLLLIYFLWTTELTQEADLGIQLPVQVPLETNEEPPREQFVDVYPDGEIELNGVPMDGIQSREMPRLRTTLNRLKASATRDGAQVAVTIFARPQSLHQRSIDVLNACAAAEIKLVTFAEGSS